MTHTVDEQAARRVRLHEQRTGEVDALRVFLRLVDDLGEGRVFLLEAASDDEGHPEYQMSLLGTAPVVEVQVKDGVVDLYAVDGLCQWLTERLPAGESTDVMKGMPPVARPSVVVGQAVRFYAQDPMAWLEQLRQAVASLLGGEELVPFSAGLLGYIGYDAVHYLEKLPKTTVDDRLLPDIRLQWHAVVTQITDGSVKVFDTLEALRPVLTATALAHVEAEFAATRVVLSDPTAAAAAGAVRLAELTHTDKFAAARLGDDASDGVALVREDVTQPVFEGNVERAKEYIRAGDIFQVVLSKRMRIAKQLHPYVAYDRLRKLNPSPYMFVAEYPDMRVFGASPEVQFRTVARHAEMKPLAGTSKGRGKTPAEDRALAERLQNDEKERAEHVMLVDLCRNDLGRVCEIGSIRVPELMAVEPYSHLFHLVSVVHGTLRADTSVFHALLATFPAGTLSGAPKIRAMEVIDELESLRRGPYGGMIGMVDFAANANTAIVIRTVIEADDAYYIQVGAGIVADSDPAQEWLECGHKAGAIIDVLTGPPVHV